MINRIINGMINRRDEDIEIVFLSAPLRRCLTPREKKKKERQEEKKKKKKEDRAGSNLHIGISFSMGIRNDFVSR